MTPKTPHPLIAIVPVVVLIGFLAVVITLFGSDSLSGGSQIALLLGMAVCVCISMAVYRVRWKTFEVQIKKTLGEVSITLLILLCVGMLSGSWMISGIVPTLIYYGVQIMSPQFFLVSACVICALVSLLSLCAMCFGAAMVASGMIESLTQVIVRWVRSRVSLVSSTVGTGIFLNITTGDQFISIVLNADIYKEVYRKQGYESRLLSRSCEDSATVTSVLIPWNTCGMTQSTVLGVPTLVYLPYCFFNLISPLMSILVATIGWRIYRKEPS